MKPTLRLLLNALPIAILANPANGQSTPGAIDHIVYATPDIQRSVKDLEQRLGVRASPGGSHTGGGTRNELLALGPSTYLEIIGPDPAQPEPAQPRIFGIDTLKAPRIVSWAIRSDQLDLLRATAAKNGVTLGAVMSVERQRSDGVKLHWQMTTPAMQTQVGLIPFYINWGTAPHPALTAAPGLTLVGLRAEDPNPEQTKSAFKALGIDMQVTPASESALIATIEGPAGKVELK